LVLTYWSIRDARLSSRPCAAFLLSSAVFWTPRPMFTLFSPFGKVQQ
jgi:hypothetical protein